MNVSCADCSHSFYIPGTSLPTVQHASCENCGGRNLYQDQPNPLHSEMEERNMPLDGKHPDTGGNPLQEGIYRSVDGGWEPHHRRDESFASVQSAHEVCPLCRQAINPNEFGRDITSFSEFPNRPLHADCVEHYGTQRAYNAVAGIKDEGAYAPEGPGGDYQPGLVEPRALPALGPMRQGSFKRGEYEDEDMVWNFDPEQAEPTHTFVATPQQVYSLPGAVPHETVANVHGLKQLGYPRGMSLGYVNDDGTTSFLHHNNGMDPQTLVDSLQDHLASNYGHSTPITVDPYLKPSTSEERFNLYGQPAPAYDAPARPRFHMVPHPWEKEWALRGGKVDKVSDALNTEPYDSLWGESEPNAEPQPDASGMYSQEVQPGPMGIHTGAARWLQFLRAKVNGFDPSQKQQCEEILARYGMKDSPDFGLPVTVSVWHPSHMTAAVEAIEKGPRSDVPLPEMQRTARGMQQGEFPWPPGRGGNSVVNQPRQANVRFSFNWKALLPLAAAPLLAIPGVGEAAEGAAIGEAAGAGAAAAEGAGGAAAGGAAGGAAAGGVGGMVRGAIPQLMKGALKGVGQQAGADVLDNATGGQPGGAPAGQGGNGQAMPPMQAPMQQYGMPPPVTGSHHHAQGEQLGPPQPGTVWRAMPGAAPPGQTGGPPPGAQPGAPNEPGAQDPFGQHQGDPGYGYAPGKSVDPQTADTSLGQGLAQGAEFMAPAAGVAIPGAAGLIGAGEAAGAGAAEGAGASAAENAVGDIAQAGEKGLGRKLLEKGLQQGAKDLGKHFIKNELGGGGGAGGPAGPAMPQFMPPMYQYGIPPAVTGSATKTADIPGLDYPGSVDRLDTLSDDPERQDQHEVNDGDVNKNPYGGGMDAGGSMGYPPFDDEDLNDFANLGDKIVEYYHSPHSGHDDPLIRALHEKWDTKHPGYLDKGDDNALTQLFQTMADPAMHHHHGAAPYGFGTMPSTGEAPASIGQGAFGPQNFQQPAGAQPAAQQQPQQGRCPNCGGVLTGDGSCPQCGYKVNPLGGATPGGESMPMTGQPFAAKTADSQGPITPEQRAAVAELLVHEHRADEIPIMEAQPWQYARELARVQRNPNEPPPPVDPNQQAQPMPAQEDAPPGATMPVPDPSQQIAAAVAKFAADSIAPRCPKCDSGSTGITNAEDGKTHCHACGHEWKPENFEPIKTEASFVLRSLADETEHALHQRNVPDAGAADLHGRDDAADIVQDSSHTWQDTSGQPLQSGRTYYLHTEQYPVPDLVKIVDSSKPDELVVQEIGEISNQQDPTQQDPNNPDGNSGGDGLAFTHKIPRRELEMYKMTFEPTDAESQSDPTDLRNNVQNIGPANIEQPSPALQMGSHVDPRLHLLRLQEHRAHVSDPALQQSLDLAIAAAQQQLATQFPAQAEAQAPNTVSASSSSTTQQYSAQVPEGACPNCRAHGSHVASYMASPSTIRHDCYRCGNSWDTLDEDSPVTEGLEDRSWVLDESHANPEDPLGLGPGFNRSGGSRNIHDVASKDPFYRERAEYLNQRAQERLAGQKYTPREQREFIDETGMARNADLLDLAGTHYETRGDGGGKAYMAPEDHLVFGL